MKTLLVTQRITVAAPAGERRDSLDQRWFAFLEACGFLPIPVPNRLSLAQEMVERIPHDGILLTGGDDLAAYGGTTPERDEVESFLIDTALERRVPLVGVCRGMQMIQHLFGVPLQRVAGHVTATQTLTIRGVTEVVNSYHQWGATESPDTFAVWSRAEDGVVKAFSHRTRALHGIMWHPERIVPHARRDMELWQELFSTPSEVEA